MTHARPHTSRVQDPPHFTSAKFFVGGRTWLAGGKGASAVRARRVGSICRSAECAAAATVVQIVQSACIWLAAWSAFYLE